jgi:uncharacterized membrane protein
MQARIRALGHPVHPMLVMFPLALFFTGTVFDLVRLAGGSTDFGEVGFWVIAAGLAGAVLAALTGFADWTKIPSRTRAKRVGRLHGGLNALMTVLFLVAWLIRLGKSGYEAGGVSFGLQVAGVVVGGVAAWLGGELVDRLGIGVADDANPNASSSLADGQARTRGGVRSAAGSR